MPKIISFINQKGGTGKTTLSLNISAILADKGYKVLLIDTDAQGNLTNTFIQNPKKTLYDVMVKDNPLHDVLVKTSLNHNLDIIPNNILSYDINLILAPEIARELKLKNALDKDNLKYDYIIIDCNPSLDVCLINVLCCSNIVYILIDTSAYSFVGLTNLVNFIEKVKPLNPNLNIGGFIFNNIDRRTTLFKEIIDAVNHIYPDKLLKTTISLNSIYPKMQLKKETILSNKNTKSYLELSKLTEEIING